MFPALALICPSCATVDPKPDYDRSGEMIRARTLAAESYDPATEDAIEDKVDALLEDGLTVDKAIQVALLNNASLQASFQNIGISRAELVQSGLLSNPMLSLAGLLPEGGGRAKIVGGLSQEIADLWQIPKRKKIAHAELERTILEFARSATSLAIDVEAQVYRAVAAENTQSLAQETLKLRQKRLDAARGGAAAGEVDIGVVNDAQLQFIEAGFEVSSATKERELTQASLAKMLGLSRRNAAISIKGEFPVPSREVPEFSALLDEATRERLDIQAAEASLNAAEFEFERQKLRRLPSVVVGLEGERMERRATPGRSILADTARASVANGALTAPGIESRAQRAQARRQEIDAVLGPSISLPIPIWDQNQAQIAKARFIVEQRYKEYLELLNSVAFDAATVLASLRAAREQVILFHDQMMPLAERGAVMARTRMSVGEQGIVVVLDAEQSRLTFRRNYISAQRDYAIALTELSRTIGRRVDINNGIGAPSPTPTSDGKDPS
ncbi:MAG: TolC family protein [Planctomycetes bacterium]|nr:TolC family protein [Planctomycetota bacterium]MBI3835170.1 TolC family protein [Planctomycetota bacterium]